MVLKRGDVVLVPFPFTDLSSHKLRPAIIISPDPQSEDILLAFISSVASSSPLSRTDFLLEEKDPDFPKTGLKKTSVFKFNKLITLHRSTILRRLGSISPQLQHELDMRIALAVGLK